MYKARVVRHKLQEEDDRKRQVKSSCQLLNIQLEELKKNVSLFIGYEYLRHDSFTSTETVYPSVEVRLTCLNKKAKPFSLLTVPDP